MATLGIHRDFLLEFATLDKTVQKRVHEVFEKFAASTYAGIHLEKLAHQRDPRLRTIRITDYWRGVVMRADSGDSYLLLKVLQHDKAIEWAAKHRVTVNKATQGIEIRDDVALESATQQLQAVAAHEPVLLFPEERYPDKVLRMLGVDPEIAPVIRLIPSEAHLEAMHKILPEQQFDVLVGLSMGMTPAEIDREIVQVYPRTPAPVPDASADDDLAPAMARARGRVALVSGPAALMEVLERPFDAWRVFLHPSQWRVAYSKGYAGPARVTGGPGTGKTVVALHRAAELARLLPDDAPDECVLLTTFTRDLALELDRCLGLLLTDAAIRAKVRVVHVDALVNEVVRADRGGAPLKIVVNQKQLLARWGRIARRLGLDFTDAFLDQEWRQVVLAQDIHSAEAYLKADRSGRGRPLAPLKRIQLWRAVEEFQKELRDVGEWTFLQLCGEAARVSDGSPGLFRHVVVDEAQDLHHSHWRFLRAVVDPGPDDLFIAGDTYQRIYGNTVSMRSLGINIVGRSHRLRINYRTTQEILSWAAGLLTGREPDDMDEGRETLAGYHATMHGARPRCVGHPTKPEEIAALVTAVREWIAAGVEPEDVAVAVRFLTYGRDIAAALERAGVTTHVLDGGRSPSSGRGVRIGTMHRMKGLEFRCVAVAGVCDGVVPMRNAVTPPEIDERQHTEDLLTERNLLFVAATRAREALRVSWHGTASPFLASD